jgi:acetyltransferase-like isoleucine patch superfamily enzyme
MSTLYLCAVGNPEGVRLALEVNAARPRWNRIVLLDDDPAKHGQEILGVPVLGPFAALADHSPGDDAVNLVARSTSGRDKARARIEGFGIALCTLVHPAVNLHGVTLGHAVTIYEGCHLSALSVVHDHAVIFTQAVLGHGATLGAGAVLAPGAVINARVQVGARAYIGTNAAVMPDLVVAEDATVSACSAVICDVPQGAMAMGVPAEIMGGAERPAPAEATAPPGQPGVTLEQVQAVFARVLGLPSVGADRGFFDAGGSSRLALDLHRALVRDLGLTLSVVDIFQFLTPRRLAAHLGVSAAAALAPPNATDLIHRRKAMRG